MAVSDVRLHRLRAEDDTAAFCHKAGAAPASGWELHGGPAHAFDAARGVMRCAQAVTREVAGDHAPGIGPGAL